MRPPLSRPCGLGDAAAQSTPRYSSGDYRHDSADRRPSSRTSERGTVEETSEGGAQQWGK